MLGSPGDREWRAAAGELPKHAAYNFRLSGVDGALTGDRRAIESQSAHDVAVTVGATRATSVDASPQATTRLRGEWRAAAGELPKHAAYNFRLSGVDGALTGDRRAIESQSAHDVAVTVGATRATSVDASPQATTRLRGEIL